jgi:putative peptidoglycan lipid II flippase
MLLGFLAVVAQGAVRFFYGVAVAAAASAAVFGAVNALLALALFAGLLWPTAAAVAASKYVALSRAGANPERAQGVTNYLGRTVAIATSALAVLAAVSAVLFLEASLVEAAVTATLVLTYSFGTYARGVLYGVGRIPRATTWDVATALLAMGGLVLLLLADSPRDILLLPLALGFGVFLAANWPFGQEGSDVPADLRQEISRFILYGTVGGLAGAGLAQLSMVIARATTSPTAAGQFAAALSLAAPPATFAGAAVLVMAPSLAAHEARLERSLARAHTDLYARALAASMVALMGLLVLASQVWIRLFYGRGYETANRVLPILLAGVLLQALAAPSTARLLVGHSQGQRIFAAANVGGLVVALLSTVLLLVLHRSVTSVAWGFFCGASVVSLIPIGLVWRSDRQRWLSLTAKIVIGVSVVASLRVAESLRSHHMSWDLLVAIAFSAGWLAVFRRDLHGLRDLTASSHRAAGREADATWSG